MTPGNDRRDDYDTRRDELAASTKALGRRAHALRDMATTHSGNEMFQETIKRAVALLDAGVEMLFQPVEVALRARPPWESPALAAEAMSRAMHQTDRPAQQDPLKPPAQLLAEQRNMCVLTGSTRAVSVPELLEFLGAHHKTGILWIMSTSETFTLQLESGSLVHASSSSSPRGGRLGDILVQKGYLTQARLDEFIFRQAVGGAKLGVALEERSLVTREQLTEALEEQVRQLFERLFAGGPAAFSFTDRAANASENRICIGITDLLLESARNEK